MSQMHVLSFFSHFSKNSFISECRVVPVFNVHPEYLETNTSGGEPERGHISVDGRVGRGCEVNKIAGL